MSTALHLAAFEGDIDRVNDLLKNNYDPLDEVHPVVFDYEDEESGEDFISFDIPMSPIAVAARFGKTEVLKLLLDKTFGKGKSKEHEQDCICTLCHPGPLHMSILGGWIDCLDLLVDHGWDVNQRDSVSNILILTARKY